MRGGVGTPCKCATACRGVSTRSTVEHLVPKDLSLVLSFCSMQGRSWEGCRGGFLRGPGVLPQKIFSVLRWLNPLKLNSQDFCNPRDTN